MSSLGEFAQVRIIHLERVDVFGLACFGMGASGFATGQSHALRRLSLSGFDDDSFGRALPYFYSHQIVGELASETDLDVMRDNRLLRHVRDVTPSSERLMAAISAGGSASSVMAWVESQGNVKAAQTHFLTRMILAQDSLSDVALAQRPDEVRDWLEDASANVLFIRERIEGAQSGRFSFKGTVAPALSWLTILDL